MNGIGIFELLIYLTLTGIIVAINTIGLGEIQHKLAIDVKTEARKIEQFLTESQLMAFHSKRKFKLEILDKNFQLLQNERVKGSLKLNEKLTHKISTKEEKIYFYPSGISSPGKVKITKDSQSCEVIISLRSRIRTQCI